MKQQVKTEKGAAFIHTECTRQGCLFLPLKRRQVVAKFDGGKITSDGGALLLREVEKRTGILEGFTGCFVDYRDQRFVQHSKEELIRQRVYGLALGYEDLNDHDQLREDVLLAAVVEKKDPSGQDRQRAEQGKPLAGKSTLNRLELYGGQGDRYKKIDVQQEKVESFLVEAFLNSWRRAPRRIVLDLDATDDPVHGQQEGRFFHGYYDSYCYLPLYIFCEGFPLCARLRSSNIDASEGATEALEKIVGQIRKRWPKVGILVRGDSGFAREQIMVWCEANQVDYVLGLAKNSRLISEIEQEMERARKEHERTQEPARIFRDFRYQTLKSWSRSRRVVAKAEYLARGNNPRFIVTSLSERQIDARTLYERIYCARGDLENRIKEQQLALFADRTSSSRMRANQVRLWFSTVAYLLLHQLRRLGLKGTAMAKAQCATIRLKLLRIGAVVKISTRRIVLSLPTGYPYRQLFCQVRDNLSRAGPLLSCT